MAVIKRKRPEPPKVLKPSPKQRFASKCNDLAIRLQQPGEAHDVMTIIAEQTNISYRFATDMTYLALCILERFDCEINTLQMNYPDLVSYRVLLRFTDHNKPLVNGRYPLVCAVKCSSSFALSVIICYLQLCSQAGRFL